MAMVRRVDGGGTTVGTKSTKVVAVEAPGWIEAADDGRVGMQHPRLRGQEHMQQPMASGVAFI